MMNRRRRVAALIVAASLAVLAVGCGTSGNSGTAASVPALHRAGNLEKTSLNVAVLGGLDSAGFFVALHEGLFAQEGLTVHYTPAFTGAVIGAQQKGQVDITGMDYVSYIEAQVKHQADLRIFAEGSLMQQNTDVIMAMPHSKVQSLTELKGHILGVNTVPNIGYLLVASVLNQNGITMTTSPGNNPGAVRLPADPKFPFPATQPLIAGQVSAVILSEPFATQLSEQVGATVIADTNTGATSQFPILGYAVTKAWAKANPNTLKAFYAALEAGQEIADTNRAAVEAAYTSLPQDAGRVDPATAAAMALSNYPLGVTPVRLQRVANVMQQFGFIKKPFDIRQLLN